MQYRRQGDMAAGLGNPARVNSPARITRCSTKPKGAHMHAFDPAVMRDLAFLIAALTALIKAIWPNGVCR